MSATADRSLGTVVRDIGGNVDRIVRAELNHALAEVRGRLDAAGDASRPLIAGAICAALAAGFLLLSIMFGLSIVMPQWLAALVVAVAAAVAAAVLLTSGRARFADRLFRKSREVPSIPGPPA